MSNRFYDIGEGRAAKANELFGTIARRYDVMNDLQSLGLHRLWKRRLVDMAGVKPGEDALDLCCGTGDIAFALARRGASVVGLDFSEPMLMVAASRRRSCGDGGVPRFVHADALQVPFPESSFDVVTIGYGLRNLAGVEAGLREMRRVARPGGRMLVLDFGKPDHQLWRTLYFGYLRFVVPALGALVCGRSEAYSYILESLRHYPAQRGVAAAMEDLGLVNVRLFNLLGGMMSINYGEKPGTPGRAAI
jgi:demethylmenaquinone methyltransferase/2-methoxy-6-polyprenyl-1,4-benzoquinol methylase